jgi:hypothetical protein
MKDEGEKQGRGSLLRATFLHLPSAILCLTLGGCTFGFGQGRSGEMVVPPDRLRTIEPTTMEQIQASAPKPAKPLPTTLPSLPTTLPAPLAEQREVSLTIEEARRLALENNLELRVDLFEPAIARQALTEEEARFEALFTTTAAYDKTDSPSATRLESNQSNSLRVTPGVELPLITVPC